MDQWEPHPYAPHGAKKNRIGDPHGAWLISPPPSSRMAPSVLPRWTLAAARAQGLQSIRLLGP
jgi:hypothetical protein